MFGKKSTAVLPSADINKAAPANESWGEIYTMPGVNQNFNAPPVGGAASSGHNKRLLIIILLILVFAIGVLGVYLAFFRKTESQPANTNEAINVNTPTVTPPSPPPPVPETTPTDRDNQRYLDIKNIQNALEVYYSNKKSYPAALLPIALGQEATKSLSDAGFAQQMTGNSYLPTVPKNPSPGGMDYLYESLDNTTYTISFKLEVGVNSLAVGDHKATPKGIDITAEVTPPPPIVIKQLKLPANTVDTDADGLTDAEEPLLGADPQKPDTDGDGYTDGVEVKADYDPARGGGAKLYDSPALATYTNTHFGYSIKYPVAWLAKAVDQEESQVIFSGADAEFVEVLVVDNSDNLSAAAWYAKESKIDNLSVEEVPTFKAGDRDWALSFDGLNAYTVVGNYLLTVSYNIGTRTEASYYELFRAMVRTLRLTSNVNNTPPSGAPPLLNTNSNINTPVNSNVNVNSNLNLNSNINIPPPNGG